MQAYRSVSVGRGMTDKTIQQYQQQLVSAVWKEGMVRVKGFIEALESLPRHLFLPDVPLETVYQDVAIPLKYDKNGYVIATATQPTMMAIMLDQLKLREGDNVLEIGTASGYNAGIMQKLVGNGRVTTVELEKDLAEQAERHLMKAKLGMVKVIHADGVLGYAPRATYDRIIATVGVWDIPALWVKQLRDDGVIVAPIWINGVQMSATFTKQPDGSLLSVDNRGCEFVYMRGNDSFPEIRRRIGSSSLSIISDSVTQIDTVRLHTLLSAEAEWCNLDRLKPREYWDGLQLYLMLNTPDKAQFFLYAIEENRVAYGLSGRGIALILPASAIFAPYQSLGIGYSYGGTDAYLALQESLDAWNEKKRPNASHLRLRLIPKEGNPPPTITNGKLYTRNAHYLHVWLETPEA